MGLKVVSVPPLPRNPERRTRNPDHPLRVLVLCYEWPPVGGGGGRAARDVAETLARRGHAVRVQTVRLAGMPRREFSSPNLDVRRTWGFRRRPDRCSPAEMAGYLLTSFGPTLRHLREFRPDVIHAHFAVPTGPLALAGSLLGGVPYVITTQLGDVPGAIPEQTDHIFRALDFAIRPVWRKAAAVTTVSRFVADLAWRAYGRRPELIPNGVTLEGRPGLPERPSKTVRLLFVGRFNRQKNLPFLFQALAGLSHAPWTLDVVGEGDDGPALRRFAAAQRWDEKVRFHGWRERGEVDALLAGSDLLVFPSTVEGLPLAVLEALKFGLGVLASDLPPLRDLIKAGANGRLLPASDEAAWTTALRDTLADPARVLGWRQASWRLAERFDLEKVTDAYEGVFRRVRG